MSGSVDQRMAEAVENASVFIMCVSREYRESGNCRMEAQYASDKVKKNKLKKVIPVMMQEDYTPSNEDYNVRITRKRTLKLL